MILRRLERLAKRGMATPFVASVKWDEGWEDLLEDKSTVLLDVRNADEVAVKSVPNAVHLPLSSLLFPSGGKGKLPGDKATPILVFCAVGGRSHRAAEELRRMGYSKVLNGGGCDEVNKQLDEVNKQLQARKRPYGSVAVVAAVAVVAVVAVWLRGSRGSVRHP